MMRRRIGALASLAIAGLFLWVLERPRAKFVMATWPNHVGVSKTSST